MTFLRKHQYFTENILDFENIRLKPSYLQSSEILSNIVQIIGILVEYYAIIVRLFNGILYYVLYLTVEELKLQIYEQDWNRLDKKIVKNSKRYCNKQPHLLAI